MPTPSKRKKSKWDNPKPKPPKGYTKKSYREAVKKHGLAGPRKKGRGA